MFCDILRSFEMTSSECLISCLPLEILSKIFNFLGHSDKKICRSVCQFWMQVVIIYLLLVL